MSEFGGQVYNFRKIRSLILHVLFICYECSRANLITKSCVRHLLVLDLWHFHAESCERVAVTATADWLTRQNKYPALDTSRTVGTPVSSAEFFTGQKLTDSLQFGEGNKKCIQNFENFS